MKVSVGEGISEGTSELGESERGREGVRCTREPRKYEFKFKRAAVGEMNDVI